MNARPDSGEKSARVLVVGGGAAGLAAVFAAARGGAEVELIDAGVGASGLQTGAVDAQPWETLALAASALADLPRAAPLPDALTDFVRALDLWDLAAVGAPLSVLATEAGRLRWARGRDRALLDVSRLHDGARVMLPRADRPEWDADALARALSTDPLARRRELAFCACDADPLRHTGEERIATADLASRHDRDDRQEYLRGTLARMLDRERAAGRRADAVLVGPWLGVGTERATSLGARLGVPVGEIVSVAGGPAGLRFETARARMLAELGVERQLADAMSLTREGREIVVALRPRSEPRSSETRADTVVLAIGGLLGGGLRYEPAEHGAPRSTPPAGRVPFVTSVVAPVALAALGAPVELTSSTSGPVLDEIGWPMAGRPGVLEAVGIRCEPSGLAATGVYAAGDAVADRPRTLLEAVASGLRAGDAAYRAAR